MSQGLKFCETTYLFLWCLSIQSCIPSGNYYLGTRCKLDCTLSYKPLINTEQEGTETELRHTAHQNIQKLLIDLLTPEKLRIRCKK